MIGPTSFLVLLLSSSAALPAAPPADAGPVRQRALRVGTEVAVQLGSPHPYEGPDEAVPQLVWTDVIRAEGASFVAPHFDRFDLAPGDFVVVRSPDGSRRSEYRDQGKSGRGLAGGFWAVHVPGDTAVVELFGTGRREAYGYSIDRYARGNAAVFVEPATGDWLGRESTESVCVNGDFQEAKCYQASEPTIYARARAVARLLIRNQLLCTGWLVGSEGHLLTNDHCWDVSDDDNPTTADERNAGVADMDVEFMAEGSSCSTNCRFQLGCGGPVVARTATVVAWDVALDYTLVQLPVNPTSTYGYLQLRASGAADDERIYIPQHPQGWGKQLVVLSDHPSDAGGFAQVEALDGPSCVGGGPPEVRYYADTRGGSSGSPVLAYADHKVVALHHCGLPTSPPAPPDPNCASDSNLGVPVDAIIADLGANLPTCAVSCPAAGPVNDHFANRLPLGGSPVRTTGSNVDATEESGEPNHAGDPGGRSVWWSWTAPATGTAVVSAAGSSLDTLLAVYTGTAVNALTLVAAIDDDVVIAPRSRVYFTAIQGTTYQVAVDGKGGATGDVTLEVLVQGRRSDANADTRADIVWRNPASGENAVWLMNGLAIQQPAMFDTLPPDWELAGRGDFDADRKLDLLWRNAGSFGNAIWFMNGTAVRQKSAITALDGNWTRGAVGDLDGDGRDDIVWRNTSTGAVAGWLMDGATIRSGGTISSVPEADWAVVGAGDLNADGRDEILWRDASSGLVAAWFVNGLSLQSSVAIGTVSDPGWSVAGVGDLDGNGRADLVWRNVTSGDNAAWLMSGATIAASAYLYQVTPGWIIARVDDLDGDGKADLVWRSNDTGENAAWLMNGTTITTAAWFSTVDTSWRADLP